MYTFVLVIYFTPVKSTTIMDLEKLTNSVLENYNKDHLPDYNLSGTFPINFKFYLQAIDNYDALSGILKIIDIFEILWFAYRLSWDPTAYGGIGRFVISRTKIWAPKLFIVNTADDLKAIGSGEIFLFGCIGRDLLLHSLA